MEGARSERLSTGFASWFQYVRLRIGRRTAQDSWKLTSLASHGQFCAHPGVDGRGIGLDGVCGPAGS